MKDKKQFFLDQIFHVYRLSSVAPKHYQEL